MIDVLINQKPLRLVISLFLILSLAMTLVACQATAPGERPNSQTASSHSTQDIKPAADAEKSKTFVTSVYPLYVAMLNLTQGVEGVEVVNLTGTVVGCLHDYQLTPGNLKTIEAADAFVYNGADLEAYIDQVRSIDSDLPLLNASEGLATLDDNPHLWVSLDLMIQQVNNLASQLGVMDPDHATAYQENLKTYVDKLAALQADLHDQIDPLPNRDIVTFHEAFPYFAAEFDLNIAAVVEREPDSKPSAGELAETIDQIRQLKIQAIFVEPQYDSGVAETIARETGIQVYTLDPASSGPLEDPDAYLNIMRQNGLTLVQALK